MQASTAGDGIPPSHRRLPKPSASPKEYPRPAGRSTGRKIYPEEKMRAEAREEEEGKGSCYQTNEQPNKRGGGGVQANFPGAGRGGSPPAGREHPHRFKAGGDL